MTAPKHELVLELILDAPKEKLYRGWTEPELMKKWFAPLPWTTPKVETDVRPGGSSVVTMRGPDGTVYPMSGVYREIIAPERLVFTASALDDKRRPLFEVLNTVSFAEQGGKTRLTVHARVLSKTAGADRYLEGMEPGWSQTLDRLGEHLSG